MGSTVSREQLMTEMASALERADDAVREAWERIRIEPEKWQCSPWGDASGGFWVVAERPGSVVWYNDIEGGFNTSRFTNRGVIDEYWCNQTEFSEFLRTLPEALRAEEFAALRPVSELPGELSGPGHVVRRQTTYWELQLATGSVVRVHFTSKQETRFDSASYEQIALFDSHPLLIDYEQHWSSLFVSQAQHCGSRLLDELAAGVDRATNGWRGADEYLSLGGNTATVLREGDGLLLRAPETIGLMAAEIVRHLGATPSLVPDHAALACRRFRVLVIGRDFVVARAFCFVSLDNNHLLAGRRNGGRES